MKVLHVIPGVAPRYGGPSTVIFRMVAALNQLPDVQAEVVATDADGPGGRITEANLPGDVPVRLFRLTCSENWKISMDLARWLTRHAGEYDVLHIHAVWAHATMVAARAARRRGVAYIVRPAGMLSPWALGHHQWKKRFAWHAFHRRDLAAANAIHATSAQEAADIQAMELQAPIAVIANGVTFPDVAARSCDESKPNRVLFLGRIHPVKGLANLLQAWQRVGSCGDWQLVLVGPDDGRHRRELERMAGELGISDRVLFVGPACESEKWQWYQSSKVFVLPSFTENFGVSVAEALSCRLPVITTTGTPWREVPERGCGWWVEPTVDALANALNEALVKSDEERCRMGWRGAEWAQSTFAWPSVADKLVLLYRWLLRGGTPPCNVLFQPTSQTRQPTGSYLLF